VPVCPPDASAGGAPSVGLAGTFVALTLPTFGAAVWLPHRRAA